LAAVSSVSIVVLISIGSVVDCEKASSSAVFVHSDFRIGS
jgi:hypothetical protein